MRGAWYLYIIIAHLIQKLLVGGIFAWVFTSDTHFGCLIHSPILDRTEISPTPR